MSSYKVPQDVEADDKLLGPFSFRQFIYLMIVAALLAIAWGLSKIFIGLAIIPIPPIIFFGALALPLRKDQPMETYLAAIVTFYLKPKTRIWEADGVESLIEITVPKKVEKQLTNGLSENEAIAKLGYLANLVDTGGWSIRSAGGSMNGEVYAEATNTTDIMDTYDPLAQSIDQLMNKKNIEARQHLIEQFKTGVFDSEQPAPAPIVKPAAVQPQPAPAYSYAPAAPVQTVAATPVQPQAPAPAQTASATPVSPDIIKLANDDDLTVETIAREAERRQQKNNSQNEVFISLR